MGNSNGSLEKKLINLVPGASLVQKAINGDSVEFSDFLPGSKLLGGEIVDKLIAGEPEKIEVTPIVQSDVRGTPYNNENLQTYFDRQASAFNKAVRNANQTSPEEPPEQTSTKEPSMPTIEPDKKPSVDEPKSNTKPNDVSDAKPITPSDVRNTPYVPLAPRSDTPYVPLTAQPDNTMVYLGIFGGVVVVGLGFAVVMSKKK